jgi:hypothetical protein
MFTALEKLRGYGFERGSTPLAFTISDTGLSELLGRKKHYKGHIIPTIDPIIELYLNGSFYRAYFHLLLPL